MKEYSVNSLTLA